LSCPKSKVEKKKEERPRLSREVKGGVRYRRPKGRREVMKTRCKRCKGPETKTEVGSKEKVEVEVEVEVWKVDIPNKC